MTTTPTSSSQNHHATPAAPGPNPGVSTAVVILSSLPPVLPPVPLPVPAPDPEADQWAAKIHDAVGDGVAWFLDAGRQLSEAKVALGHGRWMAMFSAGRIKIGLRTAEMLMRVAEHRALSDSQYSAKLPPSLTTLDVLAGGTVEVVEAGIKAGAIGPGLTAKEARSFLRAQSPKLITPTRATKFDAAKRLKHVDAVLWKELERWPDEALGQLAEKLAAFAEEVRSYASTPQQ